MEGILAAVEASAFGATMRRSVWLFPAANVLHVVGAMVFFALVAAMDVAVLRHSATGARGVIASIRPYAVAGLLVQIVTGLMLLVPEASHIGMNPAFRIKLLAIGLALLNVAVLEGILHAAARDLTLLRLARFAAAASLAVWLAVAALGRLIAYF
ncbi:hypothetical protein EDC22_1066 [Tepidamorphus gemmatus]|uniref:Uncharacterized protein n=1 Tax=Tepidamorphus gemmatus TaxID=747076 RepID=A0A4R3M9L0_9HYPH|nr:hypothetical protein [Tepidamorphus gemmatus]TCT09812.1 hypothetical protein EDC22_1066 [Tepidamorphus gemmatus]